MKSQPEIIRTSHDGRGVEFVWEATRDGIKITVTMLPIESNEMSVFETVTQTRSLTWDEIEAAHNVVRDTANEMAAELVYNHIPVKS